MERFQIYAESHNAQEAADSVQINVDNLKRRNKEIKPEKPPYVDFAMHTPEAVNGGIDLNSANLAMIIKRDGKGVPLPLAQQDMAQLSRLGGFIPEIIEIRPASGLPELSELKGVATTTSTS